MKIFDLEMDFAETNPIPFYLKLFLGVFLVIVSFFWWIHIIVYVLYNSSNFFNNMVMSFESENAMFISVFIIFGLSFYMLMATMKGTFKVGVKIPYLISFHLMIPDETLMNSFIFNVILILICSVSITHFISVCFKPFSRFSQIDMMFG